MCTWESVQGPGALVHVEMCLCKGWVHAYTGTVLVQGLGSLAWGNMLVQGLGAFIRGRVLVQGLSALARGIVLARGLAVHLQPGLC